MTDRTPTQVLPNGAIRYAVYDGQGNFLRYDYLLPADDPTDEGTDICKRTMLQDKTASDIGLDNEDPTVDEALAKLRHDTVVSADTAAALGLGEFDNPTVDDAFQQAAKFASANGEVAAVFICDNSGLAVPLARIHVTTPTLDFYLISDTDGYIYIHGESGEAVTLDASASADLTGALSYVVGPYNQQALRKFVVSFRSYVEFFSSTETVFSGRCSRVDVCVGAAGGGSYVYNGGAGGYAVAKTNVAFTPGVIYDVIVGAGGVYSDTLAIDGGSSSFLGIEAAGGQTPKQSSGGTPAIGNGNGGIHATGSSDGGAGNQFIYSGLNTTKLYGGGGGAGSTTNGSIPVGNGGSPGGGNGSVSSGILGEAGKDGLGGGAGGCPGSRMSAKGGSGIVCARMYH